MFADPLGSRDADFADRSWGHGTRIVADPSGHGTRICRGSRGSVTGRGSSRIALGSRDADLRGSLGSRDADFRGSLSGSRDADRRGSLSGSRDADVRGSLSGSRDADLRGSSTGQGRGLSRIALAHPDAGFAHCSGLHGSMLKAKANLQQSSRKQAFNIGPFAKSRNLIRPNRARPTTLWFRHPRGTGV